jgi:hypothetical protein
MVEPRAIQGNTSGCNLMSYQQLLLAHRLCRYREILRLASTGLNGPEIAGKVGMSREQVRRVVRRFKQTGQLADLNPRRSLG